MIGPGDIAKVISHEDRPITVTYANVDYILRPEVETFIPAEAVFNYFGDPRSTKNMYKVEDATHVIGWVPDRATEVRRLRAKWAEHNVNVPEEMVVTANVDVYDLQGEWQPTPAADPQGLRVNSADTTMQDALDRDAIIARMQAQLDTLLKERDVQQLVEPSIKTEDAIPVDNPSQSIQPRKQPRAKAAYDDEAVNE